jgi:hypothetical protein
VFTRSYMHAHLHTYWPPSIAKKRFTRRQHNFIFGQRVTQHNAMGAALHGFDFLDVAQPKALLHAS